MQLKTDIIDYQGEQLPVPEAYARWKSNNTDEYGARIFSYAEDWANLMESEIKNGKKISEIAQECARIADHDGITGFMYGAAATVLTMVWIHGEELRFVA